MPNRSERRRRKREHDAMLDDGGNPQQVKVADPNAELIKRILMRLEEAMDEEMRAAAERDDPVRALDAMLIGHNFYKFILMNVAMREPRPSYGIAWYVRARDTWKLEMNNQIDTLEKRAEMLGKGIEIVGGQPGPQPASDEEKELIHQLLTQQEPD